MQLIQNLNDWFYRVVIFWLMTEFALVACDLTDWDNHNSEKTQHTQTLGLDSSLVQRNRKKDDDAVKCIEFVKQICGARSESFKHNLYGKNP